MHRGWRRRIGRGAGLVAACIVATGGLLGAPVAGLVPATPAAAATYRDAHLREYPVFTGLVSPTTVRFAQDGRAFVAEKDGVILAFDAITDATPVTALDIRAEVNAYWDRGVLGLAVDPRFLAGRPYLYVFAVYDAPPGRAAPVWNDACAAPPDGPGGTTDGCPVTSILTRYTVDPATNVADPGSRLVLLRDWCQQFPSHSGGGIAFGADGYLYVAGGEGGAFSGIDYGQRGGTSPSTATPITPVNPCGDPVTVTSAPGAGPTVDLATAQGGSLRSQDVRAGIDPVGLDGTLIRISPDTGLAAPGNPLASSGDLNARRVIAHGFRNPFRIAIRPGTSEVYVANVGAGQFEEIDRVGPPSGSRTTTTMPNYGWPCFEGSAKARGWATAGNRVCTGLYGLTAAGTPAVTAPHYAYSHSGSTEPCGPATGSSGAAISGIAFYRSAAADQTAYPAAYEGGLFFTDYVRNCLAVLRAGAGGVPGATTMEVVATGLAHPVDLVAGPHGDLYYVDITGGRVIRIRYVLAPEANATATPSEALAPVTVTLDGTASVDPDPEGTLVAWDWDLDGDGSFGGPADATGPTVPWPVTVPAVHAVTLRVTSSTGLTDTMSLMVDTTNDPPVPVIDAPTAALAWSVGDPIPFAGSATDIQDGALAPAALVWSLVMHHCSEQDCHEHLVQTLTGVAAGAFTAPDHEFPSHLEVRLAAVDAHGTVRSASVQLQPRTVALGVVSDPPGVPVTVGEAVQVSPSETTRIRLGSTAVSPPLVATVGGRRLRFAAWSDGGPRVRDLTLAEDLGITATYRLDAPDTCSTAATIPTGSWRGDRAGREADADWFRFTLGSTRRVVVTVGSLPVNARLDLYGACGRRLATADHAGTRFEELSRRLPAGAYRVRVSFPGGATSDTPYAVRVRVLGTGAVVKSVTVTRGPGTVRIAGEVIASTTRAIGRASVTATFRDAAGAVVGRLTGVTFGRRLEPGAVSPFRIAGPVPDRWTTVAWTTAAAKPAPVPRLILGSVTALPIPDGQARETGTVRNAGRGTAVATRVARTWYGRRGEVLDVGYAAVVPADLPQGETGTFTLIRPALPGISASRTALGGR